MNELEMLKKRAIEGGLIDVLNYKNALKKENIKAYRSNTRELVARLIANDQTTKLDINPMVHGEKIDAIVNETVPEKKTRKPRKKAVKKDTE